MSTLRGVNGPVENSEELSYSPSQGWSNLRGIEGPKASVRALLDGLAAAGYSFTYRCDQSPKASVTFQTIGIPGGGGGEVETPTSVWEYFANRVEIDILEADVPAVNGISEDNRRKIREAINNPQPDQSPALIPSEDTAGGDSVGIYRLMLGGLRSHRINVPTLKRTLIVSNAWATAASSVNVGRIISTNTLQIQEAVPNILFNLPTFASGKSDFGYGWYKNFPTVQQNGWSKWNISQEWDYGLWAPLLNQSIL